MNWQASTEANLVMPGSVETIAEPRTVTAAGDVAGDWLCAWCLNRVATERDRFQYEGKDEFSFTNPSGIRFEIITFSQALNCRQTGVPTLEHTWFAGCAWSFCQCDRCSQHLGWYYAGQYHFVGLIKNRITRALFARN